MFFFRMPLSHFKQSTPRLIPIKLEEIFQFDLLLDSEKKLSLSLR